MSQNTVPGQMRTITLEEHFAIPTFMEGPGRALKNLARAARSISLGETQFDQLVTHLTDLGEGRIAAMDAAHIDMQILSLTAPGLEQSEVSEALSLAREVNDTLGNATRHFPNRFAGFAALPTSAPDKAADELEHTVREFGFKGAVINGHIRGRYLDDTFFWPILERAEALQVPLYLHPTPPPQPVIETTYKGNFPQELTQILASGGWGWHIETANHVLRLIAAGVFDRYPNLQIIIGHLGEGLPFMLPRLNLSLPPQVTKLKRSFASYLRKNVHYTISGFNFLPSFLNLLLEVGADRIMFSADYPYASMEEARTFLDQIPVSPADREKIAHSNAERLLRL